MKAAWLIFICAFGVALAGDQEESVMAIVVEAGKMECLYQSVTKQKHVALELDYQVTEGGEHDINFAIRNPAGVQIVTDVRKTDANHRISITEHGYGDYAICFDNSFSIQTKKVVFFEVYLLDANGDFMSNYDASSGASKAQAELTMQLSDFHRITNTVKNNLNRMEQLQAQVRALAARDRSTMEQNFERVNFWSVINIVVMIFSCGLQLFLLRSLFEENSKVGRLIRSGKLD